jgi:hypothetical protein
LAMVNESIKYLTAQAKSDKKWKRSGDKKMEKVLGLHKLMQKRERKKTAESLQMAMSKEGNRRKVAAQQTTEGEEEQ